jgi:hypothetical protein
MALAAIAAGPAHALKMHASLEPIRIDGRPGQVANRQVKLSLAPDENTTFFTVSVEDWWRSEDGKQSLYRKPGTPGNPVHSCAAWLKVNPVQASVEGGQTLTVQATVTVPDNVAPGGYWCALTIEEIPDPLKHPAGIGMRFAGSVSVGVYVNIAPLDRRAKVLDVRVTPAQVQIKLRNDGNCPLSVEGHVEFIKPGEQQPVATVPIPRLAVLPEPVNTSVLSAQLPDAAALPDGHYLVRAILDIGTDHYIGVQKEFDLHRPPASDVHSP